MADPRAATDGVNGSINPAIDDHRAGHRRPSSTAYPVMAAPSRPHHAPATNSNPASSAIQAGWASDQSPTNSFPSRKPIRTSPPNPTKPPIDSSVFLSQAAGTTDPAAGGTSGQRATSADQSRWTQKKLDPASSFDHFRSV
ncbi:hypothetical protein ACLOJK_041506 [Asimina triloba]